MLMTPIKIENTMLGQEGPSRSRFGELNGSYLQGKKQEISLRLEEDVLQQLTEGMNVKTTFDVEPGAYQIRVVLRDSGDQLLSAVNGSGFIP